MRLSGGFDIVANLQRAADTGSFRRGKLGEDGAFQSVSRTSGLRGWLVNKMESGKYDVKSWQGRVIRGLVGGEEKFKAIQAALRENREASLANASKLLLDNSTIGLDERDRTAATEHLTGNLLDIVRTRGNATAKFETIQGKVQDFARMRQAQRERAAEQVQLENEARRQADVATQPGQTDPSGSTPRTTDVQHETGKVIEGLPQELNFSMNVGGARAAVSAQLNTDLNLQLKHYAEALKTAVTDQSDKQRAETAAELNGRLDEVEAKIMSARTELERIEADFGTPAGMAMGQLASLQTRLDEQRALIIDVANNFGAGRAGTVDTPVTWGQALALKRLGLNVGANVATGEYQGKQVTNVKTLGKGASNTVYKLTFEDGSVGVFKPGKALDASRLMVSEYAAIPTLQPRYEARSIASPKLDELLGTGLLVKTEFHEHKGEMGILMEQAQGKVAYDFIEDCFHKKKALPMAMFRDVNRLQLLDAVTGQLDRHGDNALVETGPQGDYVGLKGIDNDASFGADRDYNELAEFQNWAFNATEWNNILYTNRFAAANSSGLPPVADAELAAKIMAPDFAEKARNSVEGLLTPHETELLGERIQQVQDHLKELDRYGLLISDWDSGQTPRGASILRVIRKRNIHSQAAAWGMVQ